MTREVKVTKEFSGVPDGAVHPVKFQPGDILSGDLAEVALAQNWAIEADAKADDDDTSGSTKANKAETAKAKKAEAAKAAKAAEDAKVAEDAAKAAEDAAQAADAGKGE